MTVMALNPYKANSAQSLYHSARATITNYYSLGGLNNKNSCSHSSGG